MNHKLGSVVRLWAIRSSTGFALAWIALSTVAIVADQIRQLPPRRPTAAERIAATPAAQARWRTVSGRLAERLTYGPAEYGAVWASRSGRICGIVTRLDSGVYFREPFFTDPVQPFFARDDGRRFFHAWVDCVGDHWVDLRIGPDDLGFCAVPRNKPSVLARAICPHRP
jgi:hypothetical protein